MQKINFNDRYGLTQAVIEGRKTMTRREIKAPRRFRGQDVNGFWVYRRPDTREVVEVCMKDYDDFAIEGGQIFPKYKLGEVVAVAQRYEDVEELSYLLRDPFSETYFEEVNIGDEPGYRNKLFVRAELMPHQIRITGIKCERLQDIQDADCLKEGVRYIPETNKFYFEDVSREAGFYFDNHREAFASLIDKVSGRGTWGLNPWVVVYEFELVK